MGIFVKPDGSTVELAESDYAAAQQRGYRPETPDEAKLREAGKHPLRAGIEGALRTATFSLSDVAQAGALKGAGRDPKEILARQEANPVAAGVGEAVGLFTPLPTGATKLAKGVAELEGATKLSQRVIQGSVEGGLFGLGSAIHEDAFGDSKLAGENVAAGVMGGMLAGGVLTPVLGKVADVSRSALVKAFGGRALTDSLGELAETSVMRQITMPGDLSKKATGKNFQELGRFGIDNGFFKGLPNSETVAQRARERAQQAWGEIGASLSDLDSRMPDAFDPHAAADKMQAFADELKQNPAMKDVRHGLEGIIKDFRKTYAMPGSPIEAPMTFQKAWETASDMLKRTGAMDSKGVKDSMFRMRGELQDEILAQARKIDPELGDILERSNRDYYLSNRISELAQKTADRTLQNRAYSPTDYLIGVGAGHLGAMLHGPAGLAAGLAGAAAHKLLRERGGFAVGSALEAMSQSQVLPKIAAGLRKTIEAGLEASPTFGGPFRATLENAAAAGTMELLHAHTTLAQSDPMYLSSVGMQPEDPKAIPEFTDKAHRLGTLFNAVDENGARIDKAVDGFLGGTSEKPKDREPTRAEYDKVMGKLQELVNSPNLISKTLGETAPGAAGTATLTALSAAKYLAERAPKDPNANLPVALQQPWQPSRAELRTWFRCVDAVANPAGVFDQMAHGQVTPEAMEALRNVYPRLYQEFRDRASARLAELKKPLTLKQRAQVGMLVGELDDPKITALIQRTHAVSKPPMPSKPDGREKLDVEKNLQTQAQRLENR